MKRKHKIDYIYPHLRYNRAYAERQYQDALKTYNSWSIEEREKRGFGEGGGHPHPRRFFIFLNKYFTEIKYFMSEKERNEYVFPWVVATRSERIKALKRSKVYFDIKKLTMQAAKIRFETYKINKELKKLEE